MNLHFAAIIAGCMLAGAAAAAYHRADSRPQAEPVRKRNRIGCDKQICERNEIRNGELVSEDESICGAKPVRAKRKLIGTEAVGRNEHVGGNDYAVRRTEDDGLLLLELLLVELLLRSPRCCRGGRRASIVRIDSAGSGWA